jgi:hypothetical protein
MFSDQQIAMLQTFADQAVIAIENTRLFKELQERNRALTEALDQQMATAEILRVISSSPTQLQPILDAISANAAKLCEASDAYVLRVQDDVFVLAARHGTFPPVSDGVVPIRRDVVAGRAVLDREVIHIADILEESDEAFGLGKAWSALSRKSNYSCCTHAWRSRRYRCIGGQADAAATLHREADRASEKLRRSSCDRN